MREFVKAHVALVASGVAGLLVFLTLYGPVFMRSARPEPLSRDQITARAQAFAEQEGWPATEHYAWTIPLEGDEATTIQAITGAPPEDRSALPDPAWETNIVTDPQSLTRMFTEEGPSPFLTIAATPTGEIVQYVEGSSPIAGERVEGFMNRSRNAPFLELDTDGLFVTVPEDRIARTPEEQAQALAVASEFFFRHGIADPGTPVSAVARRERGGRAVLTTFVWERPGPAGTVDTTRAIVANNRVAAYDRDLRGEARSAPSTWGRDVFVSVFGSLTMILFLVGAVFILGLTVLKRRQGEINLVTASSVFVVYVVIGFLYIGMGSGSAAASFAAVVGYREFWYRIIPFALFVPVFIISSGLVTAGAWAIGESESYTIWPQHLIRPISAIARGRFRTRELAVPTAIGYLLAFAALGIVTLLGFVSAEPDAPSVTPLRALLVWPVFLHPPLTALFAALPAIVVSCLFAMTYVKRRTKRTWAAVLVGGFFVSMNLFFPQPPFAGDFWTGVVVVATLGFAIAFVFVRSGPLAAFTMFFVFVSLEIAYPLVLSGNWGHASSGLWAMLLTFVPAGMATYGALRPREDAADAVPAHVRRVLERLRIGEEFEVARRVQAGLLPAKAPDQSGLDVAGLCVPANEVGGDYFDYFPLEDGRLAIAVGDVSGKGVPAAIYMTLTKSYMVTQSSRAAEPVRLLSRVNGHLKRNLARGTFVTMVYAVLDPAARRLTYTRAGHNPPLLIRANGEGDFLSAPGLALGSTVSSVFESITRSEEAELEPGDLLLLYTDGVTEAMNLSSDEYGEERLIERATALARSGAKASEVIDVLLKDVRQFSGRAPQHDDITIVAVRVA